MYYIFINLFSVFFYNTDLYINFEYIVNKVDKVETNLDYYNLLKEETTLKDKIETYTNKLSNYKDEYTVLISKNRNLLNIQHDLENNIKRVNKLIAEINSGQINDELIQTQSVDQYKSIFKTIYSIYLINMHLYDFIIIDTYKNVVLKNYTNNILIDNNNLLIDDKKSINYNKLLINTYTNNILIDDKKSTNYDKLLIKTYINNLLIDKK